AITDAYKRYIITLLNADSGGPLPYYYHYAGFSRDGYNHRVDKLTYGRDAVDPETFSKDPFLNIYKAYFYDRDNFGWDGWSLYPNLAPDQIPKVAARRNYSITKNFENWLYNKDELEDVLKNFYTHGWAVFKTGPAVTEEGFQFYRIPLRVVVAVFTTPKHTHFDQPPAFKTEVLGQIIYDFEDLFYTDTSSRVPQAPSVAVPPAPAPSEKNAADKLEELKGLFDAGLITEEEYKAKREKILSAL
ncbi:MAG: SHOCT domain-containing protein, partial [Spirochaetales bacterium]|nr:SHOCT domain-containing protein [Spirochaetales bacterium]